MGKSRGEPDVRSFPSSLPPDGWRQPRKRTSKWKRAATSERLARSRGARARRNSPVRWASPRPSDGGRIARRDLVRDAFFISFCTFPRKTLVDWIDKSFFVGHSPVRYWLEVISTYTADQWGGGLLYGGWQWLVPRFWNDQYDLNLSKES